MEDSNDEVLKIAKEMSYLITKNIRDVTTALTINIDYQKKHSILAAYGAAYAVASYFEYKLGRMDITPAAIQKSKDAAEKYVLDVIAQDSGNFTLDKGEA